MVVGGHPVRCRKLSRALPALPVPAFVAEGACNISTLAFVSYRLKIIETSSEYTSAVLLIFCVHFHVLLGGFGFRLFPLRGYFCPMGTVGTASPFLLDF